MRHTVTSHGVHLSSLQPVSPSLSSLSSEEAREPGSTSAVLAVTQGHGQGWWGIRGLLWLVYVWLNPEAKVLPQGTDSRDKTHVNTYDIFYFCQKPLLQSDSKILTQRYHGQRAGPLNTSLIPHDYLIHFMEICLSVSNALKSVTYRVGLSPLSWGQEMQGNTAIAGDLSQRKQIPQKQDLFFWAVKTWGLIG